MVVRSVSQPSEPAPPLQLPQPALQSIPHRPALQVAVPLVDEQTMPQPPQLFGLLVISVSHPSLGFPLQSPKPGLQAST